MQINLEAEHILIWMVSHPYINRKDSEKHSEIINTGDKVHALDMRCSPSSKIDGN